MHHSTKLAATLLLSTALTACATYTPSLPPAPASLAPLLGHIDERLAIAEQVALSKWDSGKPVEDRPREHQVIEGAIRQGQAKGLSPEEVDTFFAAQIEANKLVQYARLSQWASRGEAPDTPRPDLVGQIRPQLDRLQVQLLQSYADFAAYRRDPHCSQWLAAANHQRAHDSLNELALTRATAELCLRVPAKA